MSKQRNTMQIRQGDVFLESVAPAAIPNFTPAQEVAPSPRGVVLQEGEVTGHAHRIGLRGPTARHAVLYRTETDRRYLRVTAPVELTHEEHKTRCATCWAEARAKAEATARAEGRELRIGEGDAFVLAVAKIVDGYSNDAYRCADHAAAEAAPTVKLDDPGATVLPIGDYEITIHAEYEPRAAPRPVVD